MEHLIESVRVPCPNAAHGCAVRLAYYDRRSHRKACPVKGCGFVGAAGAVLDHVASVHFHVSGVPKFIICTFNYTVSNSSHESHVVLSGESAAWLASRPVR
ncbi:unnamed protein product [Urochloa humidicola]